MNIIRNHNFMYATNIDELLEELLEELLDDDEELLDEDDIATILYFIANVLYVELIVLLIDFNKLSTSDAFINSPSSERGILRLVDKRVSVFE